MKQIALTPKLYEYILDISLREHPVLAALREETSKLPLSTMQIAPEQGQFMQFLLRMMQAKQILEIGTFTGYSALAMALALPKDGQVITCDINEEWTKIAQPFWQQAEQQHKIQLRLGPALESLTALKEEGIAFDFIFIDADKANYLSYYEYALQLIRPGGVIAIDNVLWDGQVIDETDNSSQTRGIKHLNAFIKTDSRVDVSLLAIADGLLLIMPKSPHPNPLP